MVLQVAMQSRARISQVGFVLSELEKNGSEPACLLICDGVNITLHIIISS